jgi:Choline/Carnitine o-acyltransferase
MATMCVQKTEVGKRAIVACNLSPDAAVQLAIQLAYFRLTGSLKATYEVG